MAISVNILRLRVTRDCQARAKNGQPAHSTTGVARTNWSQLEVRGGTMCRPATCPAISSTATGTDRMSATQKRRRMSTSSGFGSLAAVAISGSSAMPQIGQTPGPCWRISGCIGQV